MNIKLKLIVICLAALLLNSWGCSDGITPQINTSLPHGITITYLKSTTGRTYWKIEKEVYATISINGEHIQSWCGYDNGYMYRNLTEGDVNVGDMVTVDIGSNGFIDYTTFLKR